MTPKHASTVSFFWRLVVLHRRLINNLCHHRRNHFVPGHLIDEALDIAIREADTLPHSDPLGCLFHDGVFVLRVCPWPKDEQRAMRQLQLDLRLVPHMLEFEPTSRAERRRQHTAIQDKITVLIMTIHRETKQRETLESTMSGKRCVVCLYIAAADWNPMWSAPFRYLLATRWQVN